MSHMAPSRLTLPYLVPRGPAPPCRLSQTMISSVGWSCQSALFLACSHRSYATFMVPGSELTENSQLVLTGLRSPTRTGSSVAALSVFQPQCQPSTVLAYDLTLFSLPALLVQE